MFKKFFYYYSLFVSILIIFSFFPKDPSSSFSNTRQSAIRLKHLPMGTVTFQTIIEKDILGTVSQDTNSMEPGLISYGQQKSIIFFSKDCDPKHIPKLGDKVKCYKVIYENQSIYITF